MTAASQLVAFAYGAVPALTILVAASLAGWIYARRWEYPGAKWFAVVLVVGSVWNASLLVHVVTTDSGVQTALQYAQMLFAMWTFSVFVVFVSVYTRQGFHRHPLGRVGLAVGLVGSAALVATSPVHDLVYAQMVPRTDPFHYVASTPGLGYVAVLAVVVTMIGYGAYTLVQHLMATRRRTEFQLVVMLVGILSVAGMELVGSLGIAPADGLNHAAYGTLPFVVLMAIGLFQLRLFDVEPVARNSVVERLLDPILVVDRDGQLVDSNRAASEVWPAVDERVGDPLETVADELAPLVATDADEPGPLEDSGADEPGPLVASNADEPGPLEDSGADEPPRTRRLVVDDDGDRRHFMASITPVERRHSDEVGWYAISLRDVSTLERSRRRLERQNDHLAQVGSTISHDLRNPIQVASGYTDFVELTICELAETEADAEPAFEHLSRIDTSLDRMNEIIEDVLTLSREGRSVESTSEIPISAAAREAWRTVDTGEATLEIDREGSVQADRSRLLSIFENLFRNAMEHAGSAVTVTVAATDDGFAVADDGPGIPPEHRDEVFQYGYTTATDGTGLGLAIVRTMAESHGWTVSIDDACDDGTRFVFDCRAATDAGDVGSAADRGSTDGSGTSPSGTGGSLGGRSTAGGAGRSSTDPSERGGLADPSS